MAIVKQFFFGVDEKGKGKNSNATSQLPTSEMITQAFSKHVGNEVEKVWVSRHDLEKPYSLESGIAVHPKNGVPCGQVWLFIAE